MKTFGLIFETLSVSANVFTDYVKPILMMCLYFQTLLLTL